MPREGSAFPGSCLEIPHRTVVLLSASSAVRVTARRWWVIATTGNTAGYFPRADFIRYAHARSSCQLSRTRQGSRLAAQRSRLSALNNVPSPTRAGAADSNAHGAPPAAPLQNLHIGWIRLGCMPGRNGVEYQCPHRDAAATTQLGEAHLGQIESFFRRRG